MSSYRYILIELNTLLSAFQPPEADSYLSDDAQLRALRDALEKGYRWVRSEGDYAVFEKKFGEEI